MTIFTKDSSHSKIQNRSACAPAQGSPNPRRKINLFDFTDYRAFLSAFARDKKKLQPSWSLNLWARQLGLRNSTSISKIITGSRDAGPEILRKLAEYFKFTPQERAYFEGLVQFSKAEKIKDDTSLKAALMEQLRRLHPGRTFAQIDEKKFSLIAHWWFYAIRQMTHLENFRLDSDWISTQLEFKISPREIARALEILQSEGLLVIDKTTGRAKAVSQLNTSDDVASEALRRFHEGVLEMARSSLRTIPTEKRQISGLTLPIRTADRPRVKQFLREMEDRFIETFEAKDGDSIYQLELAFFPLTKSPQKNPEPPFNTKEKEIKNEK